MNLSIRQMSLQDIEAVKAIDESSFPNPWPPNSYRYEILENNNSRPWVLEMDNGTERIICGMAVVWMIIDEAHVGTIAIHPDFRGQGLGEYFLAAILLDAVHQGMRSAYLEVRASNIAAQKLYQKFGFVKDSIRKNYYRDNGENAVLMSADPLQVKKIIKAKQNLTEPGVKKEKHFGSR